MPKHTSNHPNGSPCWLDIDVPDFTRAVEFYTAVFGWEVQEGPEEFGGYSMCLIDGVPVAAIAPARDKDAPAFWWNVYFAADDVDATAKLVTDNGGKLEIPPMDIFGAGRMTVVKDQAGAEVGFYQGQAHPGAGIVGEPGTMCWAELNTPDSAGSRDFYAKVLQRPVEDMGVPGLDYATVMVGEETVAGIGGVPGEEARWTVYFAVDDADAAVARVTAAGGSLVREAQDNPYGRFASVADPFGAVFAVMRLAAS